MRFSCFECPLIGGDNSGGRAHAAGCGTTDSKSYAGSGLGPVSVNQRGSASDREEYRLESQPPVHFKAQATKTNLRRGQCEATACLHAGGHTTSNAPDRAKDFASSKERSRGERRRDTIASCAGTTCVLSCAHAGSRTRVTSMGGLYDAATLRAQFQFRDCVVQTTKNQRDIHQIK